MTRQNEAFEKWFTELEPHTVFNYDSPVENFAWWGWQAAQADQAERVKELEESCADLIRINMERTTENAQLQLENQKLREALEFYSDCNHFDNNSNGSVTIVDHGGVADKALGETK